MNEEIERKIKEYKISAVPTAIINGKIKIVGKPSFNAICSPEIYKYLEENFKFKDN